MSYSILSKKSLLSYGVFVFSAVGLSSYGAAQGNLMDSLKERGKKAGTGYVDELKQEGTGYVNEIKRDGEKYVDDLKEEGSKNETEDRLEEQRRLDRQNSIFALQIRFLTQKPSIVLSTYSQEEREKSEDQTALEKLQGSRKDINYYSDAPINFQIDGSILGFEVSYLRKLGGNPDATYTQKGVAYFWNYVGVESKLVEAAGFKASDMDGDLIRASKGDEIVADDDTRLDIQYKRTASYVNFVLPIPGYDINVEQFSIRKIYPVGKYGLSAYLRLIKDEYDISSVETLIPEDLVQNEKISGLTHVKSGGLGFKLGAIAAWKNPGFEFEFTKKFRWLLPTYMVFWFGGGIGDYTTEEVYNGQKVESNTNPRLADVGIRFDKTTNLHSIGLSLESEYLQPNNSDEISVSTFNNEISGYYYLKF